MNCQEIEELLTPYLLGDLDAARTETVRQHLEECEICRAAARELDATLDLAKSALATGPAVPARLDERRRHAIRQSRVQRKVIWFRVVGSIAAAAVLLLIASDFAFRYFCRDMFADFGAKLPSFPFAFTAPFKIVESLSGGSLEKEAAMPRAVVEGKDGNDKSGGGSQYGNDSAPLLAMNEARRVADPGEAGERSREIANGYELDTFHKAYGEYPPSLVEIPPVKLDPAVTESPVVMKGVYGNRTTGGRGSELKAASVNVSGAMPKQDAAVAAATGGGKEAGAAQEDSIRMVSARVGNERQSVQLAAADAWGSQYEYRGNDVASPAPAAAAVPARLASVAPPDMPVMSPPWSPGQAASGESGTPLPTAPVAPQSRSEKKGPPGVIAVPADRAGAFLGDGTDLNSGTRRNAESLDNVAELAKGSSSIGVGRADATDVDMFAGWDIRDGQWADYNGKGKSGNETADQKEAQNGRAGMGRQGVSDGESAGGSGKINEDQGTIEAWRTGDSGASGKAELAKIAAMAEAAGGGKGPASSVDETPGKYRQLVSEYFTSLRASDRSRGGDDAEMADNRDNVGPNKKPEPGSAAAPEPAGQRGAGGHVSAKHGTYLAGGGVVLNQAIADKDHALTSAATGSERSRREEGTVGKLASDRSRVGDDAEMAIRSDSPIAQNSYKIWSAGHGRLPETESVATPGPAGQPDAGGHVSAKHGAYYVGGGVVVNQAIAEKDRVLTNAVTAGRAAGGQDRVLTNAATTGRAAACEEKLRKPVFRVTDVNPWIGTDTNKLSTFSIDVDTASYTLSRNYMLKGSLPPPAAVRVEEFVNFFDYAYPPPTKETFSVHANFAPSPFRPGVQLLKIGIKGCRIGREQKQGVVLTLLVDTSGSMNTPDRLGLIKKSLALLVEKLGAADRVALVQFDSQPRLVLAHTPASEKQRILAAIDALQTSGYTHLEEGLRLGYEIAARGFRSGAANRVLLLSDGMANLGTGAAEDILKKVESYRQQGIYCSVFGFGLGNYDDSMLVTLADKGNGSYQFIDSMDEAKRVLVDELAATLHTIAADVKIQVEFDPRCVAQYRQLGYEKRRLKAEDFRNDAVDAGEVGSGQSVTALYELQLKGNSRDPLGTVRIRYRDFVTGRIEEVAKGLNSEQGLPSFDKAEPRFKLAAGVAEFAELLRGSPYTAGTDFEDVARILRPVAQELSLDQRVQELLRLVQAARSLPAATESAVGK